MTSSISTLSRQLALNAALTGEQSTLASLNSQLASGQNSTSLSGYSPVEANQLLNFQNGITQKQSYIASVKTVQARLSVYDSTMTDMESLASQAQTLASGNLAYNSSVAANIQAQATVFLQQTGDDLNQKVGDQYIYAGARYNTQPVADLTTLTDTVPTTTTTDGSTLPDYDAEYQAGTTADANAYTKNTALIDTSYSVPYGVTSTDPAFQQLISGLRLMKSAAAAGQAGDTASYNTQMTQASSLLSSALTSIQGLHAGVADTQGTMTNEATTQQTNVTNLQNQITNIQSVDLTTVGTEINLLTTQLQASYSATASFEQLSLVKYL